MKNEMTKEKTYLFLAVLLFSCPVLDSSKHCVIIMSVLLNLLCVWILF